MARSHGSRVPSPAQRAARTGAAITAISWALVLATVAVALAAGQPYFVPQDFLPLYL